MENVVACQGGKSALYVLEMEDVGISLHIGIASVIRTKPRSFRHQDRVLLLITANYGSLFLCSSTTFCSGDGASATEGEGGVGRVKKGRENEKDEAGECGGTEVEVKEEEIAEYNHLRKACEDMGVAKSPEEAAVFARVLDKAGFIQIW